MDESTIRKQLDLFLDLAKDNGYLIRQELLGGIGSSLCEVQGKRCLFLDLSCGPADQLESIKKTLALTKDKTNNETARLN